MKLKGRKHRGDIGGNDTNKGESSRDKYGATVTEAKRTTAGRGGRGKGNSVRDVRQYKVRDGPIDRGTEGQWEVAGIAAGETELEGSRAGRGRWQKERKQKQRWGPWWRAQR